MKLRSPEDIDKDIAGITLKTEIDLTPTWSAIGEMYIRFAESNEQAAIRSMASEIRRAFAIATACVEIDSTLTESQRARFNFTYLNEMKSRNLDPVVKEDNTPKIAGRLPIRHAVIKLGYMIIGAGRFRDEAIKNAEACEPGVTSKIVEDAESMELADGEIFVASIENDFFDGYFSDYNCFEKIGEDWSFKA